MTMLLPAHLGDTDLIFLVDFGSTHSFLNSSLTPLLPDVQSMKIVSVTIAGGGKLGCDQQVKRCHWNYSEQTFHINFRLLQLGQYDGILGLDWLASHSPMVVDWEQKGLAFQLQGTWVTLQGELREDRAFTVMVVTVDNLTEDSEQQPEIQLLQKYHEVFTAPTGLPPSREYDNNIPLVPGARPVSIRPYRVAPHLKTEMEKQIDHIVHRQNFVSFN